MKNNKHFQRSYGASFAVEMQQNGVKIAYKDMYNKAIVKNSLSAVMNIPLKVKVSGCMGNTHIICYQTTLSGSKELNLVSKK